jgi:hypothetical protein
VNVEAGGNVALHFVEKLAELLRAMARHACADHAASLYGRLGRDSRDEAGKERRSALVWIFMPAVAGLIVCVWGISVVWSFFNREKPPDKYTEYLEMEVARLRKENVDLNSDPAIRAASASRTRAAVPARMNNYLAYPVSPYSHSM